MSTGETVRSGVIAVGAALGLMVADAGPAAAQTAPPGVTSYGPEAFADSAPATAADMLDRVPGFTVVEADADVRGYAGALGNVLIDGVRPSKREGIDDLLARIPAGRYAPLYVNGRATVEVEAFALDRRPVTRADYLAFVRDNPRWRRGAVSR